MHIIRDVTLCPPSHQGAVVALGNFDGVHLGHQSILARCRELAKASGAPCAVMSFEPHPREFFSPASGPLRIYPFHRKARFLRALRLDTLFSLRFNRALASMSAEDFVTRILHDALRVEHVVTGHNFAFGKGRGGNTEFLAAKAKELGFGFTACPPVAMVSGEVISSSAIRALLAAGDMEKAAALLGRPYDIAGRVRHGDKRGRTLGYPTANIALDFLFKPRFGVYAARLISGNVHYDAVASLGVRPMYGTPAPLLEAHVFDASPDLYGRMVRVELVRFLRDEQRFGSEDELKHAIANDCKQARDALQNSLTQRIAGLL